MKKALIIIDIQNDYFEGGAFPLVEAYEASLNAKTVLDDCRSKGVDVVHIQHINPEGAPFFLEGTKGVEIHTNVMPASDEKVVVKHYPNSFRETDLLIYLQEKNINELIICGMMTSMCVDATTRAAKDFGYSCVVIGDACAAPSLEIQGHEVDGKSVHYAFLAALNSFYATVMNATDFLNK